MIDTPIISNKLQYYLAGSIDCRLTLTCMRNWISETYDCECTSEWLDVGFVSLKNAASMDYKCIDKCDIMIATYPTRLGSSSEMGYALAKKIPIIYLVDKKIMGNLNDVNNDTGFSALPVGALYSWTNDDTKYSQITPGFVVNTVDELVKCLRFIYHILTISKPKNKCRIN